MRQVRVTAIEDTRLLYLPAKYFYKLFRTSYDLEKLEDFCETIDEADIIKRVQNNWHTKKKSSENIKATTMEGVMLGKKRLVPWFNKGKARINN